MHTSPVIDLEDLDDLIRLAKQHGTAVFNLILNFIHLYYVRGVDNVTYRYVLSTGTKGIQEKDSTDETLENTLPRHFTDNNPFNLPRSLNDFEEMKKDSDKGETHLESYRETQSHNSENAILKTSEPDLDNHLEYVISAVRIEFTEPNR